MTTPSTNQGGSTADLLLRILTTTNAVGPAVIATIGQVLGIIRNGREQGLSDAEIEATAADSMATALRVREKSAQQMSDQP